MKYSSELFIQGFNNYNNMFKQDDHFSYKNCYQYGFIFRKASGGKEGG